MSREAALSRYNDHIDDSHLMLAIFKVIDHKTLSIIGFDDSKLKNATNFINNITKPTIKTTENIYSLPLTKRAENVIRQTVLEAKHLGENKIEFIHFVLAILHFSNHKLPSYLNSEGITHMSVIEKYTLNKDIINSYISDIKLDAGTITFEHNQNLSEAQNIINSFNFFIGSDINATLNVEEEALEFSDLLYSLNFDQGMMVGLFGRWGRGKTFFWSKVWKHIKTKKTYLFHKVEYHAWKYQDTPASWAYLYENMAKQYLNKPTIIFSGEWLSFYHRLFKLNITRKGLLPLLKFLMIFLIGIASIATVYTIANLTQNQIKLTLNWIGIPITTLSTLYIFFSYAKSEYSSNAKDLFLKYSKKHSFKEHLGVQAEIQKEIEKLLITWIPREHTNERIIIFVDDIDRCKEEKIIEIIDSLRIMLDNTKISKRLIVVTAVDERVLKRAIENKYYDLIKSSSAENKRKQLDILVREYMDKLFIAGIKLNTLSFNERGEILESLTRGKIFMPSKPNMATIRESNAVTSDALPISDYDITNPILQPSQLKIHVKQVDFEIDEFEYNTLRNLLSFYNDATPRTIKIFYYRYLLAKRFAVYTAQTNHNFFNEWNAVNVNKSILPYLILNYTIIGPDCIHSDILDNHHIENSSSVEIELFKMQFSISKTLWIDLLKIVEIVVPY